MSEAGRVPQALESDSEDVAWALSTAHVMWTRGERLDAIKWIRRASDQAADAGDDDRAFALARAAADLKDLLSPSLPPPPPPPPMRSPPPTSGGGTPSGGINRPELPGPPRLPSSPSLEQAPSASRIPSATATLVPTTQGPGGAQARFNAPLPTTGSRPPPAPIRRPPSNAPPGRPPTGRPPPLPARGAGPGVRLPPAPLQRSPTPANHTPAPGRTNSGAANPDRPGARPLAVQYSGSAGRTVPGIGYFSGPTATGERTPGAEAGGPGAAPPGPLDAPNAASIERELTSLTSTVETPAPEEAMAAAPSSKGRAAAAAEPSSGPQAGGQGPATPTRAAGGEGREVPQSPPTPRVDALGISVEALRAWLVPSPEGPRLVIWSPVRPPGAIEVVVLATQAGVNLRTLLS
ncbi:MAG TPA: hypothetical protein VFS43_43970 [Polyangiaceae bacterium]|nr:hypothetical protein [Polyangiaceae bacterium]